MTTTVKVEAQCPEGTEVQIDIKSSKYAREVRIQSGASFQEVVHGDIEVTVKEVSK